MTIIPIPTKSPLCVRLLKAMGIDFPVTKFVLEMDATNSSTYMKLYIVAPADYQKVERLCDELEVVRVADLSVNEDGTVHIVGEGK